jgi:hypothetical protein
LPVVSVASVSTGGVEETTFGDVVISTAGGEYRLCWCAGGSFKCDVQADFRTDIGALTLVGVSPLSQHRTCISGRHCSLHHVQGVHLNS